MKSTRIALAVASAFLLAACSFGSSESSDDESSAAKSSTGVVAVVDTEGSGCKATEDDPGDCYLPLYAGSGRSTRAVNYGGSCTREDERDCWPQPGERLPVQCAEPGGEKLHDAEGNESSTWVAVAIPKDRVLAENYSPELDKQGRAIVFASALWFRIEPADARFPSCSQFFTSTNDV